MLRLTPTHSNYIKIWVTQSFVTFKTQWKNETFRILFTLLRNVLLEMQSKILLYTKKHFPVKKCIVLLDWLYKCFINSSKAESRKYLTNTPELLKSEKYILRGILFWLASWFFLQDSARSTNRVRPIASRCAFRKV